MEDRRFDLKKYRTNSIWPKLRYFFDYLDIKFGDEEIFDNMYFELLNEEDFLDSLEYYIEKASPARQ